MRLDRSYRQAFLAAICTLIAIACYELLPKRVITLYPGDNRIASIKVYSDKQAGGTSEASWIDEQRLHWRCDVREAGVPRFCGLHMIFFPDASRGFDLTGFESVRLKINANITDQRIRVVFRNFEAGFSTEGNISSAKYMNALIPREHLVGPFNVALEEFSVAEWWINQWHVPRGLAYPKFNDIRTMSIDLGSPAAIGVHELQLESLQFVGQWVSAEQWYLGIMLSCMGFFVVTSLYRYAQMHRHLAKEQQRMQALVRDTDELETKSSHYKELSQVDKLTGTLNRHGFDQVVEELRRAGPAAQPLGLLIVDLDRFKQINDKHGHDIGDKVLVTVAQVLLRHVRDSDHVVRWGGEEFVILCPSTDEAGALTLAENLRARIAAAPQPGLTGGRITASIGVGCLAAIDDFELAFKRVDAALYSAKHAGRNRVGRAEVAA